MSKENPENLTEIMDKIRGLRDTLQKVITETIQNFEAATGLMIDDIELHRVVSIDSRVGTKVTGVTISMRL